MAEDMEVRKVYSLVDVEERARQHPETFRIPSQFERQNLVPGDVVQLIFRFRQGVERMWVEVRGRDESFIYEGALRNTPGNDDLRWGDAIHFQARHVARIGPRLN